MSVLIPCYDVPQDSLASLCAMLLCSCTVNVDPWKVRKTITPERYDDPSMRRRLLKIAEDTHGGLSKKGKAYHLYYTRKSFVLYLVEQCGLMSRNTYHIPDFVKFGTKEIQSHFLSGLTTHLCVDIDKNKYGKRVDVESSILADDLNTLFTNLGYDAKVEYKRADGKYVKYDKYLVTFF